MTPGSAPATFPLSLAVTAGGSTVNLAATVTTKTIPGPAVYHTSFDGPLGAEWTGVAQIDPVAGYAGYGASGSLVRSAAGAAAPLRLTLTGLPAHTSVSLRFIFAAIDSWDGSGCGPGPDYFNVRVDGTVRFSGGFEEPAPAGRSCTSRLPT